MRYRLAVVVLGSCLLLLPSPLDAQELTSGAITGRVVDPGGKGIEGVTIIATSAYGIRTTQTDATGEFSLPFLKPGSYSLRVEPPTGTFTTVVQSDVVVALDQKTVLNFTLEPGKTETVTVTGRAPLVDPTSTAIGTNLDYEEFANSVPIGRSFTDTYAIAPGAVSGLGTGQGNSSISGASGLENAYLIDGVNITNTGYGGIGSYNIIYGSLGTGVTSEFLDEVEIKSAGFEAEYGQALGGIVNTTVKSGTNDFKGSVAWYASPTSMRTDPTLVDLSKGFANTTDRGVNDFAFSVGGPIRKDKLFYFVAYNPVITTEDRRATSNPNPAFAAATAGVLDSNGQPVFDEATNPNAFGVTALAFPSSVSTLERRRTAGNYAFKLSWQATPNQQVELTAFGDPATGDTGAQRPIAPLFSDFDRGGGESEIKYGSDNQALKWNIVAGQGNFMEFLVGHHQGRFRETSALDQPNYRDLRNLLEFVRGADHYRDPATGEAVAFEQQPVTPYRGGIGFTTDQDDETTSGQFKMTNLAGKHEIKYGLEYNDISYRDTAVYTGPSFNIHFGLDGPNGLPLDADGDGIQDSDVVETRGGGLVTVRNSAGDVGLAYDRPNVFRVTRARLSPEAPATKAREYNGFVQDAWTVHPRLTINAGVRLTTETVEGTGEYSLTLAGETTQFTPADYTFAGNLSPRFGAIWDVVGNGRSRLWVNWARYFQRVPNDLAVRAFSNEVGISRAEFTDRALTSQATTAGSQCEDAAGTPVTCAAYAAVAVQGIEPTNVVAGVKLPYEDEISGGYSFEITPHSSFEVRSIYRNQGRVLEDTQVNAIEQIQNFYYGTNYGYPYDPFGGSPASPQSTQFPAAPFGAYELANPGTHNVPAGGTFTFPKANRVYKALEMIYTRRFSDHWFVLADYRYARLNGNYEGLYRNDNAQSDPNITSLYDFPDSPLMRGQFLKGPLPSDVTHVLRVHPSYQFDNKLRVGASFAWSSGVPRTSMLAHPIYQNAGEIPGIDPVYAYWSDPDVATGGGCDSASGGPCTLAKTDSLADALSDPLAVSSPFLFSYTPVTRGNLGRTPDFVTLDLHADYPIDVGKSTLTVMADVFNLFNNQEPFLFDDNIELQAGVPDPDFLKPREYQDPRAWRIAARWNF